MLNRLLTYIKKLSATPSPKGYGGSVEYIPEINRSFVECQEFLESKIIAMKGSDWVLVRGFANPICIENAYDLFPEILETSRTLPIVMIANVHTAQIEFYAAKWLLRDFQ